MTKLLPVFIGSLILAYLAEKNSTYEIGKLGEKRYVKKDKLFFTMMAVIMILLVGLRTSYNDTYTYRQIYENIEPSVHSFGEISWIIGDNPGFSVMNTLLRVMGISTQNYFMFYAIMTVGIYIWFVRKYSDNILLTVFLFFTMGCYTFTMAAIKQCVAVAFALLATDRALAKRWGTFIFWILLACTFHPYAIMYAVVPFLIFKPWTRKTFILLGAFGLAGVSLEAMLGTIVNITTLMGEGYDVASFTGDGVNIFRLAVIWAPVIVSFMTRKFWQKSDDKDANAIMNLTMLNAEIMFIALFGTANYFARLANYFLIFQPLALPRLLKFFTKKSERFLVVLVVVCYFAYFYYAEGILYGGFDALYKGISLLDYIKSIFMSGL